jgi:glycosyltransferase involved in cell wall biosynthesis
VSLSGGRVHVAIDVKNLALYSAGIAAFVRPLIANWLSQRPDVRFSLVGPPFDTAAFAAADNWRHVSVAWPSMLPRPLRHPIYDNLLFPRALARLRPQLLFSPYHDVRLPRPTLGIRSVIVVHDTCIADLKAVYPWHIRSYYLAMLRLNLKRATHVLTVSEASRTRIQALYGLRAVSVVCNATDAVFSAQPVADAAVRATRAPYGSAKLIFYAGGSEYRKNVGRLIDALGLMVANGEDVRLLVTGSLDAGWRRSLRGRPKRTLDRVHFLGRLESAGLKIHYASADAVVYPTLCEGFGRVCLEAMLVGTPLACSDLPVLREVTSDYARYFDPVDPQAIAEAIRGAIASGRQIPRQDARFSLGVVTRQFTELMDRLLPEAT